MCNIGGTRGARPSATVRAAIGTSIGTSVGPGICTGVCACIGARIDAGVRVANGVTGALKLTGSALRLGWTATDEVARALVVLEAGASPSGCSAPSDHKQHNQTGQDQLSVHNASLF